MLLFNRSHGRNVNVPFVKTRDSVSYGNVGVNVIFLRGVGEDVLARVRIRVMTFPPTLNSSIDLPITLIMSKKSSFKLKPTTFAPKKPDPQNVFDQSDQNMQSNLNSLRNNLPKKFYSYCIYIQYFSYDLTHPIFKYTSALKDLIVPIKVSLNPGEKKGKQ